jgi:hypothetical protein
MTRPFPFNELFELPIGGEMVISPNSGETPDAALKRIKHRTCKWKSQDRAYRMKLLDGQVYTQRTPMGCNGKLSDWLVMKAGDRLLLKSKPTAADVKRAQDMCSHINGSRNLDKFGNRPKRRGQWEPVRGRQGLLVLRVTDDQGTMPGYIEMDGPAVVGWHGEWP